MSFVDTKKKIDAESIEKYGVVDTINSGMRIVKIENIQVGVASSDEDETRLRETLAHFGDLSTRGGVIDAMLNMQKTVGIATDLRTSGMKVEKELTDKNGIKTFLIDGKLYDSCGNCIAE